MEKVGTEILTCPAALSISYTSSLSAQVDRMLSTLDVVMLGLDRFSRNACFCSVVQSE